MKIIKEFKKIFSVPMMLIIILASFVLSGCVKYDLGINFVTPNHGEFSQHIILGDQLQSFNTETQTWLDSIQQRTKQLGGKVKRISNKELIVTIPFYQGKELETKFNQFFLYNAAQTNKDTEANLTNITSHLSMKQGNFVFLLRNKIVYELDLSSLALISNQGNVIVSPGNLLDLEFTINSPWGAKNLGAIAPISNDGHRISWKLKTGELNRIELAFWMPNYLGIGTLIIVLIVVGGYYLKYRELPGTVISE